MILDMAEQKGIILKGIRYIALVDISIQEYWLIAVNVYYNSFLLPLNPLQNHFDISLSWHEFQAHKYIDPAA